jgi:glycosyltransferase involved in cell wall biosynthesis
MKSRFLSLGWLENRLRVALGIREKVPRPIPIRSGVALGNRNRILQSSPLKILAFTHNLKCEGAPVSLKELLIGLKRYQNMDPMVISFHDGPLRYEYEEAGVSVEIMPNPLGRIFSLSSLREEVISLARTIGGKNPDIVFANTLLNFHTVLASEEAGLPCIWNPREGESWDEYFKFLPNSVAAQAIAAIGIPKVTIFVAESTRARWGEFESLGTFKVIHNSLNISRFSGVVSAERAGLRADFGWARDEVVFVCVGTICERKGQLDALDALSFAKSRLESRIRLVFVGDEPDEYSRRVRRAADNFRKDSKICVDFCHSTSDIGEYYAAADALVLCARSESYPRVILEAMFFGLPIIATKLPGIMEQISGGASALVYSPGKIEELAKSIERVSNSPVLRAQLSIYSRTRFDELADYQKMVSAYAYEIRVSCGWDLEPKANLSPLG